MPFARPHVPPVLLRLLLVAAVAVGHCCLMGHTAWAGDAHGTGASAHPAVHPAPDVAGHAHWAPLPDAPMVCDGAHAVTSARPALPAPTAFAVPVAVSGVRGPAAPSHASPAWAERAPPDAVHRSRATLQVYLI
jgi:hypothetical protein